MLNLVKTYQFKFGLGKNVIIFGVENSSSTQADNRKNILILGEWPAQGLEDTSITAEPKFYCVKKKNGSKSFLHDNDVKIYY